MYVKYVGRKYDKNSVYQFLRKHMFIYRWKPIKIRLFLVYKVFSINWFKELEQHVNFKVNLHWFKKECFPINFFFHRFFLFCERFMRKLQALINMKYGALKYQVVLHYKIHIRRTNNRKKSHFSLLQNYLIYKCSTSLFFYWYT